MSAAQIAPSQTDPAYARGVALVLMAGVFWSIAGLVMRLIHAATEWQVLFYRSATLILVLVVYIALRNRGAVALPFRTAGPRA